uniref:Transposase (putative) gypsy type domain-containing protein n=1 Tax=Setaria italica TaxID=4555 RepID=K3XR26_SETIT
MKKTKMERSMTQELPWSLVDDDPLAIMVERALISDRRLVRPLGSERVPTPKPNKVVVFVEQYECGLHFSCSDFLSSMLAHYKLEIQHISPNSLVRLSTFEWAFRTEGAISSARTVAHLYVASVRHKFHIFKGVKKEVCCGQVFFHPWDQAMVPTKAYKDRRETAWLP